MVGKAPLERSEYAEAIGGILGAANSHERLRKYLLANSNLPGPRANLGLANAFADAVGVLARSKPRDAWELCLSMCAVSAKEAPSNSRGEFLSLCGTVALGSLGVLAAKGPSPISSAQVLAELKRRSHDERWRTREAVAIAIQRMLAELGGSFADELTGWISDEDWLQMQAVVVGVAEPPLLKRDRSLAETALALHKSVISRAQKAEDRKSSEFKVLRQALGFTLSVVVAEIGGEGFEYMRELASTNDDDLTWVLKENLKKDRLKSSFPKEVAGLEDAIQKEGQAAVKD